MFTPPIFPQGARRLTRRARWSGHPPPVLRGWDLTPSPSRRPCQARRTEFLAQTRGPLATYGHQERQKPKLQGHLARTPRLAWNCLQHPAGSVRSPPARRLHRVRDKVNRPAGLTLGPQRRLRG